MTSALAVETIGLSRRYGRRWALSDVSLGVPAGSVVMLAGRNGSGKSTLLRVLATALRPDHGSARVAGHDVRHERDAGAPRASRCSATTPSTTRRSRARENLQRRRALPGPTPRDRAPAAARARSGSSARADDPVSSFSAGMRKRLALARVLLQDAAVVLLDEPYGELDPPGFALLDGVIGELRARAAHRDHGHPPARARPRAVRRRAAARGGPARLERARPPRDAGRTAPGGSGRA